ncbi:M48 family peptidase [Nostoc sp. LEGE 12447]|uniref:M48 family peptidase n=1 Tax=Nostoc sp. LEGE 12447 TaxID=1828640 RepID=UPI002AD4497C|nr:M48 family peptidase [Nostoc sp. LEGE 12447]
MTAIEKICFQQQVTPANLTSSSRQIYSWMKFLTDECNLQLHLRSTYYVRQIAKEILSKQDQESVEVMIEFTNLALLYKGKKSSNVAKIVINEGFINASKEVLQAVVKSALLGNSQASTRLIRSFASSSEYSDVLLELDLIAEVIAENAQGKFYNLHHLFDKLNYEYFAANLVKPRLTWSQINTYRKFGHYETARDRVVISLTLDDANIPEFVAEFVLYHELLHKYHGIKWVQGRRMVHTKEFRVYESRFKLYKEASVWLKKLASSPRL